MSSAEPSADLPAAEKPEAFTILSDKPTTSHALAMAAVEEPEEKGEAQVEHDEETKNLGWNEPPSQIENPLVGGLNNDDLWILIRRFDKVSSRGLFLGRQGLIDVVKQMYHLKEVPHPVPGGLDLNIADEEEFSPDKLRCNIERLYMTVIIGIIGLVKHVARIRSWRERRRTTTFCLVRLFHSFSVNSGIDQSSSISLLGCSISSSRCLLLYSSLS
jgi:hypothetical protein